MTSTGPRARGAEHPPGVAPAAGQLDALIRERVDGSIGAIGRLRDQIPTLVAVCTAIIESLGNGGTVYTCGNGGSAAQALHLAEELIGRYRTNRPPLRAVCLNADPTALTCIANDFGFDQVFARQCQSLVHTGDALIAFSTSGNSTNVVEALRVARGSGATTIGLLGHDGGRCLAHCDFALLVPLRDSAFIQDAHQVALHVICEWCERMSHLVHA